MTNPLFPASPMPPELRATLPKHPTLTPEQALEALDMLIAKATPTLLASLKVEVTRTKRGMTITAHLPK